MKDKILYIHGLSSSGASSTARNLRTFLPEYEVISPDLPIDPIEALDTLRSLCIEKQPKVVIGTSMGGMFAQQIRGFKKILVNPAFHVSEFMRSNIGTHEFLNPRQKGETSYVITPELCDAYQEVEKEQFADISDFDKNHTFALFGNKDTLVDGYDEYKTYYTHAEWFDGEHRLSQENVERIIAPLIRYLAGENSEERLGRLLKESPMFALSLSSKELFHSNFLYWIGTRHRDLFVAICKDLGCSTHWERENWEIKREYNNYDLCIECNENKDDIPFVLENKVKSIPYKEQLDKYAEKLEALKNPPKDLVLLSLTTDFSDKKAIIEEGKWKVKSYMDLYNAIVRNKNKFVSNQYDLFLIEDYCLFIKCLHELAKAWEVKPDESYLSKVNTKKIYKELRIDDLYNKIWYNQAFNLLKGGLEVLKEIKVVCGADIKEIKESKYLPLENIFINWGFTHGQGLLEAKVKVSDQYVLLIQLQGNRYCHGVEWIKSCWQSHTEYWADTQKDELIRQLSFFQFKEDDNVRFPVVCESELVSARNAKDGSRIYNKYGDRFLYQSKKISSDASVSEVLKAIIEETSNIIRESKNNQVFNEQ